MDEDFGLFDFIEHAQLRTQAIELLDHCLTEGNDQQLLRFIDQQIAHTPPRTALLQALTGDLQLRFLSLREHRFDVRDRIVRMCRDFGVDITPIAAPEALDQYHLLRVQDFLACVDQQAGDSITPSDVRLLRKAVEASIEIAAQLTADIQLTENLQCYLLDWLEALQIHEARHHNGTDAQADTAYWQ